MSESAPLWQFSSSELLSFRLDGSYGIWQFIRLRSDSIPLQGLRDLLASALMGPLEKHWFSEWRRRGLSSRGAEGSSGCLVNVDLLSCSKCTLLTPWQNAKLSKKWGERQTFDLISAKALVIISPKWGVSYVSLRQGSLVLGDKVIGTLTVSSHEDTTHLFKVFLWGKFLKVISVIVDAYIPLWIPSCDSEVTVRVSIIII